MENIKYPYVHNELLKSISGYSVWVDENLILSYFTHKSNLSSNRKLYKNGEPLESNNGISIINLNDGNKYTAKVDLVEYYFNGIKIDADTYIELERLQKTMVDSPIFSNGQLRTVVTPNSEVDLSKNLDPLNIIGSADLDELLADAALYNDSTYRIGIDRIYKNRYSKSPRKILFLDKVIHNYITVSKNYISALKDCNIRYANKKSITHYKVDYKLIPLLNVKPTSISIRSEIDVATVESEIIKEFENLKNKKESNNDINLDKIYQSYESPEDTLESLLVKIYGDYLDIESAFGYIITKYDTPL